MSKKPLKTGFSMNANTYPIKGDGPYSSLWHDHIEVNGELLVRLEGIIDIKTVAACMNLAFRAGRQAGEKKA